jgi:heme ABC exporter ATP-binding subunit CcmA
LAPALADVDVQLNRGERLLLLGPNGAGKSTFIRVFAGLMRPAHGEARVMGKPARLARDVVGVVSHATFLYEELTALENLRFYAELYAVSQANRRAAQLLDQVGLGHMAHEQVGRLSRGQQQRVALARAMLHDPAVLLLDEPDTGLDLAALNLLEAVATQDQRTVVLTTHNLAAGLRLGSRVMVLAAGRVLHEQHAVTPNDYGELAALLHRLATG